ncbi:MAG: ComF family protein [Proteobacteria bacterium]|nr:ComF family protein [Pseudomonadota bacterium]
MRTIPWSSAVASLAGRLFGGTCYLCRGASRGVLCPPCAGDLPRLPRERCPRCALPTAGGAECGRCIGDPPGFDATLAVFAYAFPADVLVQGLKFRGELALAPFLADELPAAGGVDLVIPVPLHALRLRERGYNQSMEIARSVGARFGLPVAADVCERVRDTPAQLGLPLKERRENVRGAFSCRRALDGRRVAVVDDVMTTGATLGEVAATLKRFGATRVVNWVVARTLD